MKLVVGNCSTWSMRALTCLEIAGIAVEDIVIPLGEPGYEDALANMSDSMLVPVLIDGETKIHDSLAIAEYANELSSGELWPQDTKQRAIARSVVCELHSGFPLIRTLMPFGWDVTAISTENNTNLQRELRRLSTIWQHASGEFYFSDPSAVDAFYAVLAYRLNAYGVTLSGPASDYQTALLEWPLFQKVLARARTWAA